MQRREPDHFLEHGFAEQGVNYADTTRIHLIASVSDAVGGSAFPKQIGTSTTNGMYLVDEFAIMFATSLLERALVHSHQHYDGDAICEEAYELADKLLKARRYHYDKIQKEVTDAQ